MYKSPKFEYILRAGFSVFLLSFFLLMQNTSWSETRKSGKVVEIRGGKIERFTGNGWKQIEKNSAVSLGDRLRTDQKGLAVVEMPDIGRYVIGPSSEIEIGKDQKNHETKMERGFVWLKSNLPKGSKARITTSLATAGIRGTAFSVCSDGKYYCACTCLGEVEVTLDSGQVITVPKGKYIDFTSGSPIPEKTQPAISLLEKAGTAFDFCFNCHILGGKGQLKQNLEQYIPLQ